MNGLSGIDFSLCFDHFPFVISHFSFGHCQTVEVGGHESLLATSLEKQSSKDN